ncbi:condensin complex, subunit 1, partial [Lactifluus volemus]
MPGILMNKLLDVIMSGFATEVDAAVHDIGHEDQQTYTAHKIPMEMYAFLLNWSARSVEKGTYPTRMRPLLRHPQSLGRDEVEKQRNQELLPRTRQSNDQIVPILTLIAKVLKLKTSKIWTVSGERDTFIGCLIAPAYHVTENEQYMQSQPIKL